MADAAGSLTWRAASLAGLAWSLATLADAARIDGVLARVRTLQPSLEGAGSVGDARVDATIAALEAELPERSVDGRLALARADLETWRERVDPDVYERWLQVAERDLPACARIAFGFHRLALAREDPDASLRALERCLTLDPTHVAIAEAARPHAFEHALGGAFRERWRAVYAGCARALLGADPTRAAEILLEWEVLTGSPEIPAWFPRTRATRLSAAYHALTMRRFAAARSALLALLPSREDARIYTYLALAHAALDEAREARAALAVAVGLDPSQRDHLLGVARHLGLRERVLPLLPEAVR